jgi:transcriptional regulator with GAF, ATPase, and Fis domain
VDDKQRYIRLRLLTKKLNKERKKQAKQIDILCNDLIAAHRDFIKKLDTIRFTADFCESILGATDISTLLHRASRLVKDEVPDANVAFIIRRHDDFGLHIFESNQTGTLTQQDLEKCFTGELVDNICKSNKLCTIDDMFAMGLEANLTTLSQVSAATVPLSSLGSSLGFILIYRPSQNELTVDELRKIAAITRGLSRAVQSCQALSGSAH